MKTTPAIVFIIKIISQIVRGLTNRDPMEQFYLQVHLHYGDSRKYLKSHMWPSSRRMSPLFLQHARKCSINWFSLDYVVFFFFGLFILVNIHKTMKKIFFFVFKAEAN